jgi:hypothetical protein
MSARRIARQRERVNQAHTGASATTSRIVERNDATRECSVSRHRLKRKRGAVKERGEERLLRQIATDNINNSGGAIRTSLARMHNCHGQQHVARLERRGTSKRG